VRVLITGAAGYLGGFVVRRLAPWCALRLFDLQAPVAPTGAECVRGDISDYDAVRAACAGQEAVVHLVALVRGREREPPTRYLDVMVKGTHAVCEGCVAAGVRRLVNVSSIAVRPWDRLPLPTPELPPGDFRAGDLQYQLAKSLGEEIGRAYHEAHGLEVLHLRPGIIEGDGANPGPTPPPDGRPHWNAYVRPEEVAQAVEGALHAGARYGVYQIVSGGPHATHDVAAARRDLGYRTIEGAD
jgi:NAD+ dependent glucose-6-phosphate dehydrogenase